MPVTLNESHALFGNVISCVCVDDDGVVKDLANPASVFSLHADASIGSGAYGRHLTSLNAGFTAKGAAVAPSIPLNTLTNPNITILWVYNSISNGGGSGVAVGANTNFPNISVAGGVVSTKVGHAGSAVLTGSTDVVDTNPHTICLTRTGEASHELIVDGSSDATGGGLGFNASDQNINYIGGYNGQGSFAGQLVWQIIFNKVLSPAEYSGLLSSLGANNQLALVEVADSNELAGSASSESSASAEFEAVVGTLTTGSFKNNEGALFTGLSGLRVMVIDPEAGVLVTNTTGHSTHGTTAVLEISDEQYIPGKTYAVAVMDGTTVGIEMVTAV